MGYQGGRKWPKRGQRRGAEVLEEEGGSLQGGGRKSQRRGAEVSEEGDRTGVEEHTVLG